MPAELQILVAVGVVLGCLTRLWWIWWTSICLRCGYEHRACECPPDSYLMRRR
jgi:hypothetical protein